MLVNSVLVAGGLLWDTGRLGSSGGVPHAVSVMGEEVHEANWGVSIGGRCVCRGRLRQQESWPTAEILDLSGKGEGGSSVG